MRKLKWTSPERTFTVLGMIAIITFFIVTPRPLSPIERWHNAIEEGKSWNEYTKED